MFYVLQMFRRLPKSEKAQALTEYGLIIALVAIVLIGAIGVLSGGLGDIFNGIGGKLTTEAGSIPE